MGHHRIPIAPHAPASFTGQESQILDCAVLLHQLGFFYR